MRGDKENMTLIRSLQFLLVSLLYLLNQLPKSISTPNFVYNWCPPTLNFALKSKYQKNLNTVLESLSSNSTNPDGFHYTSSGNNGTNDAVYGNFLCRGDLSASACSDCVNTATKTDLPQKCPNSKKSIIWYDECMVRYSNKSFYGHMVGIEGPGYTLFSNVNVTRSQNEFFKVMEKAMKDVADQAANGTSRKKFGTSIKNVASSLNLYALGQCTPDLTASDCHACLTAATASLAMSDGARFLLASCNVRYEDYSFFATSSAPAPAPALPPPPSSGGATPGGGTSNPTTSNPPRSASCKMTPSHDYLNILMGFVMIFWAVNFYLPIIY